MTPIQEALVDALDPTARRGEDLYCYNAVVCRVTGRCPTLVGGMTDEECEEALDALTENAKRVFEERVQDRQELERRLKLRERRDRLWGTRWGRIWYGD